MGSYKDVSTMLDAYHQLERGRSVGRLKTAARRLRALDPANELLPELEARIETRRNAGHCSLRSLAWAAAAT
jgi:hypothetical protein